MSKNQNNEEEKFIERLVNIFGKPNENELLKDIEKAKALNNKSRFLNSFINKYSNTKIDIQTGQKMIYEIIRKIIALRTDFLPFIKIYLMTEDEIKSQTLRNHFILKNKKVNIIMDDNLDNSVTYFQFGVNLSCIYDIESYYHKFIKGLLLYFQSAFKENYLYEYIGMDYFKNLDESKIYKDQGLSLEKSLNNMLLDMNRIIYEQTNKEEKEECLDNSEKKMTHSKFGVLRIKAHLHKNAQIGSIYDKCKNDVEILKEVDNLIKQTANNDKELFLNLTIFKDDIENYLENEKLKENLNKTIANNNIEIYFNQKQIRDLKTENDDLFYLKGEIKGLKEENKNLQTEMKRLKENNKNLQTEIKRLKENNKDLKAEITELKEENQNLKAYISELKEDDKNLKEENQNLKEENQKLNEDISELKEVDKNLKEENRNLKVEINGLKEENNKLKTEIGELKKKVDFMEPIVLSIICRKAINYSIIQILEKYKKKIEVTVMELPNNDIKYKIAFNGSVNNIDKDTLNNLVDNLFGKKDKFNEDSHLVKKDLPPFIQDLWDKVKEHLKLNKNEITAFDALITNEIKSNFNFGGEDLSIKDYLKKSYTKEVIQ